MMEMLPWRQDAEPNPQSTLGRASVTCLCPPHRFNFDEGTPPTNFDTFPAAIMTVFQVWSSPGPRGGHLLASKIKAPAQCMGDAS